jgi:hypothetical protein
VPTYFTGPNLAVLLMNENGFEIDHFQYLPVRKQNNGNTGNDINL